MLVVINGKWHLLLTWWLTLITFLEWVIIGLWLALVCRRVLIFPKGNNVDCLSMYLDVADSSTLPYGWNRYAQFSLAVVNQINPKYSVKKGTFLSCFGAPKA